MFETIKATVTKPEFLIGAGIGALTGSIGGYIIGRRRNNKAIKELKASFEATAQEVQDAVKSET